jgi:hypothetical protein
MKNRDIELNRWVEEHEVQPSHWRARAAARSQNPSVSDSFVSSHGQTLFVLYGRVLTIVLCSASVPRIPGEHRSTLAVPFDSTTFQRVT